MIKHAYVGVHHDIIFFLNNLRQNMFDVWEILKKHLVCLTDIDI